MSDLQINVYVNKVLIDTRDTVTVTGEPSINDAINNYLKSHPRINKKEAKIQITLERRK
jgi:hypothetical protein